MDGLDNDNVGLEQRHESGDAGVGRGEGSWIEIRSA